MDVVISTSIQLRITEQLSGPQSVARRLPGTEPDTLLANEAQALLDAAAGQEQVETERLRAFARACLELSETGRLALAVLDGGLFVSRRALAVRTTATLRPTTTTDDNYRGRSAGTVDVDQPLERVLEQS